MIILDTAITFARNHADINNVELRTIGHCRKSLLFSNSEAWKKKSTYSSFDVTIGSYDGAEICELVGISTLSKLKNITSKDDIGLYRDDGLILLRELNGQQTDKIRKNIKVFKSIGFQIELETNLHEVNFLDITFNLRSGIYRSYKKSNDKLLYVHTLSNHPPQTIRLLPLSINERLCNNSSSETVFESTKLEYQEALRKSGYKSALKYKPKKTPGKNRNRRRNIIWFNPPFSKNVTTNVAKIFFRLLEKHFPKPNKLHKIFNRNTVKVSYSCTENVSQIIKIHNKRVTKINERSIAPCNCRDKNNCPMNGNCRVENVVYKCVFYATEKPKEHVYIGVTEGDWKQRYHNHTMSFRNQKR